VSKPRFRHLLRKLVPDLKPRSRCTGQAELYNPQIPTIFPHPTQNPIPILVLTVMENHFLYNSNRRSTFLCFFPTPLFLFYASFFFSLLCVANIFYAPTPTKQSTFQTVFSFAAPLFFSGYCFSYLLLAALFDGFYCLPISGPRDQRSIPSSYTIHYTLYTIPYHSATHSLPLIQYSPLASLLLSIGWGTREEMYSQHLYFIIFK